MLRGRGDRLLVVGGTSPAHPQHDLVGCDSRVRLYAVADPLVLRHDRRQSVGLDSSDAFGPILSKASCRFCLVHSFGRAGASLPGIGLMDGIELELVVGADYRRALVDLLPLVRPGLGPRRLCSVGGTKADGQEKETEKAPGPKRSSGLKSEDRGSKIEDRAGKRLNPRSTILDPRSSILNPQSSILNLRSSIFVSITSIAGATNHNGWSAGYTTSGRLPRSA